MVKFWSFFSESSESSMMRFSHFIITIIVSVCLLVYAFKGTLSDEVLIFILATVTVGKVWQKYYENKNNEQGNEKTNDFKE